MANANPTWTICNDGKCTRYATWTRVLSYARLYGCDLHSYYREAVDGHGRMLERVAPSVELPQAEDVRAYYTALELEEFRAAKEVLDRKVYQQNCTQCGTTLAAWSATAEDPNFLCNRCGGAWLPQTFVPSERGISTERVELEGGAEQQACASCGTLVLVWSKVSIECRCLQCGGGHVRQPPVYHQGPTGAAPVPGLEPRQP